jgi:hypothetical protein
MATVDRFSPTSFEEQPHVHYQIRDNLDTPVLVFNSGSEGLGCERWTIPPGGPTMVLANPAQRRGRDRANPGGP